MEKQKAKAELHKLLQDRYSLKSTIDLYEMDNLTNREREILQYGFQEGQKAETLVVLYDLFDGNKDSMQYLARRVTTRIDELITLIEDEDYPNLVAYLKNLKRGT